MGLVRMKTSEYSRDPAAVILFYNSDEVHRLELWNLAERGEVTEKKVFHFIVR